MDPRRAVAGFVLAGGASSRMGRDKALIEIGGEPMVARIAREVEAAVASVTIVGPPAHYGHLGFEVVPDLRAGIGPLGGIETALSLARAEWNLVIACDLPGVTAAAIGALIDAALESRADCVLARRDRPEPLFAVYSLQCAPRLRAAIDAGIHKVTDALRGLEVAWHEGVDLPCLANLNTPQDLEAFLE